MTERNTFGCLIRGAAVTALLAVVIGMPITTALWFWTRSAKSRVEELTAQIRQQGMPTSQEEARAYYDDAIGDPNITDEWLAALKPFKSDVGYRGEQEFPLPGTPWADRAMTVEFLRERQSLLDELHRVASLDGDVGYRFSFDLSSDFFDHFGPLRSAARLLSLEALIAAHDRDEVKFVNSVKAILKLGETLDDEPTCISYLVHVAIDQMACGTIHVGSGYIDFTAQNAKTLVDELGSRNYQRQLTRALAGERGIGWDYFLDFSKLTPDDVPSGPSFSAYPFKYQDLSNYLEFMSALVDASSQPFPAALDAASEVSNQYDNSRTGWQRYTHIISDLMLPATDSMFSASARIQAINRTTTTAIAAEIYRDEHGMWPSDLTSLVPKYLAKVPNDPFSGLPLRYRRTEAGFQIYSFGKDRTDDGGQMRHDGGPTYEPDIVLDWPRPLYEDDTDWQDE